MWKKFKEFAFKGNIFDMAIGVVVGGAFGKIVTSLVNDIIMPFFGFLTAGMEFKSLKWILSPAVLENGEIVKPEAAILYGSFIQNIVDFLIIAFSIFLAVSFASKAGEKLRRQKEEEAAPETPALPSEAELLMEIRDLLQTQKNAEQQKSDELSQ